MPFKFVTADIGTVVANKTLPGVTSWNRLEGRPRTERFDRALRAEVRDALWMLSKQWQMGEFQGDDAGSPIFAKVRIDATRIRSYRPGTGPTEPFDDGTPLEARVERMPVPLTLAGHPMALDLRLMLGRYWLKLMDTLEPLARPQFVAQYPIHVPGAVGVADAATVAHPEAWSLSAAATSGGRAMDGVLLYQHLASGGQAADGIAALVGREAEATDLGRRFVGWFDRLITQPPATAAWQPDRLEYQFACAAPAAAGASPAGQYQSTPSTRACASRWRARWSALFSSARHWGAA
jgi:hypothetical protein